MPGRRNVGSASYGAREELTVHADPQHKAMLEWAIVKELSEDGAFDECVKGVHAIAHTASPFRFNFTVRPFGV